MAVLALCVLVLAILTVTALPTDVTVIITTDEQPWPHFWSQSVGSGHMLLALREDYRNHLRQASRELGFKYVRGHGLLDDDMSVSFGPGINSYINVDSIIDFLLSINMRPILELSFMPEWLASGNKTVCHYKVWVCTRGL
jgi:xylan 1,4-beta-xylosidase